jgi:hypothetical protein
MIYDQHRAAFSNVSAYVVMRQGERVASIAFKYPRDGAGRLYAYVHFFGVPMVRGFAAGGGYDKRSAACASAARHVERIDPTLVGCEADIRTLQDQRAFLDAMEKDDGHGWDTNLRKTGFDVWQAV